MTGPGPSPVRVQTRFERASASVRGAFVLRGADGNPHSCRIQWARLTRIPSGPERTVAVEDRLLDVGPTRDLFVPFEVPVADLEPSWYVIRSSVQVDGGRSWVHTGRPFPIPWPRADVVVGSVVVDRPVRVGRLEVRVDRVELGTDRAVVWWTGPGAEAGGGAGRAGQGSPGEVGAGEPGQGARQPEGSVGGEALLVADGRPLEPLPPEAGGEARAPSPRRSVTYPVPRGTRTLAVVVRLSGRTSAPLVVPLPGG